MDRKKEYAIFYSLQDLRVILTPWLRAINYNIDCNSRYINNRLNPIDMHVAKKGKRCGNEERV